MDEFAGPLISAAPAALRLLRSFLSLLFLLCSCFALFLFRGSQRVCVCVCVCVCLCSVLLARLKAFIVLAALATGGLGVYTISKVCVYVCVLCVQKEHLA